ncbi:MAG: zf-TFIIB domain-containing protein [Vulcanimicrobiota bacterium]
MHLCPNCVEPLRSRTMSNFTVDECPLCDGLWFDDQVPETMVCTVDKPQFFFEPIAFEKTREVPEGQLQCPRCKLTMEVFIVRGVPVDVCPECRGMWLDSHELRKILAD